MKIKDSKISRVHVSHCKKKSKVAKKCETLSWEAEGYNGPLCYKMTSTVQWPTHDLKREIGSGARGAQMRAVGIRGGAMLSPGCSS